jgi:hypothetical protein
LGEEFRVFALAAEWLRGCTAPSAGRLFARDLDIGVRRRIHCDRLATFGRRLLGWRHADLMRILNWQIIRQRQFAWCRKLASFSSMTMKPLVLKAKQFPRRGANG